ncbi:protein D2 [Tribolium castaneum]|uniref:Odorant-binding protein A5-like Protein n=1 Tax=Tribolium castaneum TaxID=7070 RepID=D6WLP5_TRICA|nr:PREDICTED: protein D2 [Tribolium castaneum]EFA04147.2 Putative odorant-binding protein A5-like Protein [Tribolium castaneum]|eukprot:XP_972374.2 PREDICTED: protein D2 [Tribolium castaneum]
MKSFICVCFVVVAAASAKSQDVEAFTKSQIAPDVVHVAPSKLLKVEYKKTNKEVHLGNELAPKDVRDAPSVTYSGDPHAFYTLVMTDPDAPSRKNPKAKEWNHWLVGNIPGSDLSKAQVLTEYVGAGPPKDTGLHRYVFLLYKQPGKITFQEEHKSNTNGNRAKFSTENFAKKYGLGNPVAGNFYQAKFDDSVPALHSQLH